MNTLRLVILLVGCANVAAGAVLGVPQTLGLALPPALLAAAFGAQAIATYALVQLESWQRASGPPPPHG
jgi:hypothetical protein